MESGPPKRRLRSGASYWLVTEEEILGLSFLAFRSTATMLHIPVISTRVIPTRSSRQLCGTRRCLEGRWAI
jgi:hypothetical protein